MSEKPLPRIFRQDSCLTLDSSASYKEAYSTTPSSFINGPLETASTFSIREPRPSDAASFFCILAEPTDLSVADGGRTAWLTVLGSVLVFYSSFGIINSFGFFQDYYSHEFLRDTAPSTIAFVGTLQIGLMNVLSTVSGALCDEYGLTWLYIGSGAGSAVALVALSFTQSGVFWQVFLIQGILMGFTIAFGVQAGITVASQHFKKRLALAMGLVCTGSAAGGVMFPIMFRRLLPLIGFPWMLRVAAVKIIVCYAIAISISTSNCPRKTQPTTFRSLFDFKGFLDVRYSVLAVAACFAQLGLWVPYYYIDGFCALAYPGTAMQGYLLPLINGTSIIGMIIGGIIGDSVGRLNTLYPFTLLSGSLCLTLWLFSPSLPLLILFACLYGFCSGVYTALLAPVITQLCPEGRIGARLGAFYPAIMVSSLTGTPIAGALLGSGEGNYRGLISFAGGALIMGGLVMMATRLLHNRNLGIKF